MTCKVAVRGNAPCNPTLESNKRLYTIALLQCPRLSWNAVPRLRNGTLVVLASEEFHTKPLTVYQGKRQILICIVRMQVLVGVWIGKLKLHAKYSRLNDAMLNKAATASRLQNAATRT